MSSFCTRHEGYPGSAGDSAAGAAGSVRRSLAARRDGPGSSLAPPRLPGRGVRSRPADPGTARPTSIHPLRHSGKHWDASGSIIPFPTYLTRARYIGNGIMHSDASSFCPKHLVFLKNTHVHWTALECIIRQRMFLARHRYMRCVPVQPHAPPRGYQCNPIHPAIGTKVLADPAPCSHRKSDTVGMK